MLANVKTDTYQRDGEPAAGWASDIARSICGGDPAVRCRAGH
jgi:hypothetical protein